MQRPRPRRRWSRQVGLALALGGALSVVVASLGIANHYDSMYRTGNSDWNCTDGLRKFCQTDNATLTVHRGSSLSSAGKENIRATLDDSYNTTALNVSYHSDPVTSGSAETDIMYRVAPSDVPSGAVGIAWCDDAVESLVPTRCDQHYVSFEYNPGINLACHETGHAVGLTHGAGASPAVSNSAESLRCMRTPLTTDRWLGSHNADQINATYS